MLESRAKVVAEGGLVIAMPGGGAEIGQRLAVDSRSVRGSCARSRAVVRHGGDEARLLDDNGEAFGLGALLPGCGPRAEARRSRTSVPATARA